MTDRLAAIEEARPTGEPIIAALAEAVRYVCGDNSREHEAEILRIKCMTAKVECDALIAELKAAREKLQQQCKKAEHWREYASSAESALHETRAEVERLRAQIERDDADAWLAATVRAAKRDALLEAADQVQRMRESNAPTGSPESTLQMVENMLRMRASKVGGHGD